MAATEKGALQRGKSDGEGGDLLDWMVGSAANTGDYLSTKKNTSGPAGGAGAGVVIGTMLGGPVGAMVGGIIGGVASGAAMKQADRQAEKGKTKREASTKGGPVKPGTLSLD
jgi:hypothetical protein